MPPPIPQRTKAISSAAGSASSPAISSAAGSASSSQGTRNSGAASSAFLHEAPVTPQLIKGSPLSQPLSPLPGTRAPVTPKESKSDDESDQAWGSWRDDGKGQEEWVSYDEGQEGYDDDVRDRNGLPPGGGPRNRAIRVGPTGSARGTFKANAIRVLSGVTGAPLIRVTGAEANPRPVVIDLTRATASRAGPVPPPGAVPLLANPASLTPTVYHGNLGKEAEPAQPLVVQLVTAGWKNLHNLKEIHGKIVAEPATKWAYCPSKAAMDAQLRRLVCPQALQALGSRYK